MGFLRAFARKSRSPLPPEVGSNHEPAKPPIPVPLAPRAHTRMYIICAGFFIMAIFYMTKSTQV